jgi:hypothetical protein
VDFSTKQKTTEDKSGESAQKKPLVGDDWEQALDILSSYVELEETAKSTKAILRRREVKSAADLLRMVLAYSICDWSLRMVGAWYGIVELGNLSDVAVLKRLRGCQTWLEKIIFSVLQRPWKQQVQRPGVRIRIMDGTAVSQPGSTGTDWRLHLSMDLENHCLDGIEVTDAHTGETFVHCSTHPGDIRLGDRGYAFPNSMGPVLASDGWLVVRINWQNLRLENQDGMRVDLIAWLHQMTTAEAMVEHEVVLGTPQGRFPLRLIIAALPQEAADKARNRLRKIYRKKGKTPDKRTLLAAGFTMVVTNLPPQEWKAQDVLKLYRFRWQVEILIKRMKSILNINYLRTQDPVLAQVYLLGKLLGALLIDEFMRHARFLCPHWFSSTERPVSIWRFTLLFFDSLRTIIRGMITLPMIFEALPHLNRFLCDTPRKRPQQLALARSLLAIMEGC